MPLCQSSQAGKCLLRLLRLRIQVLENGPKETSPIVINGKQVDTSIEKLLDFRPVTLRNEKERSIRYFGDLDTKQADFIRAVFFYALHCLLEQFLRPFVPRNGSYNRRPENPQIWGTVQKNHGARHEPGSLSEFLRDKGFIEFLGRGHYKKRFWSFIGSHL